MKEISISESQQVAFGVLLKIKKTFEKFGWKFYLTYGTLLGAIRHNGFIPWDDDIDVWVPRKDYEAFLEYYKNNPSDFIGYTLFHYTTCKDYIYPIARLSDNKYLTVSSNQKEYGLGVFVDIYPIDGIPLKNSQFIANLSHQKKIIQIGTFNRCPSGGCFFKTLLKYPLFFYAQHSSQNKRLEKIDKTAQRFDFESSPLFTCSCWEFDNLFDKEWISSPMFHKFNGVEFLVPNNYNAVLTKMFGDYMTPPPVNERIGHHFYKTYLK
jgi:lipopolysaccharide cholinephosphotransferase